ncbi:hypothetical protein ARMGADRAFT_1110930 [Armillaria gallica]|uniref:Uncharacterized protein n=1 Tax=Armillaria gallica TaxID=47427 RepID=A0A2H3D6X1_ARMGA|nr:hypothetical protein ARMGADRAFT_1110930 [Armillaria gallica]
MNISLLIATLPFLDWRLYTSQRRTVDGKLTFESKRPPVVNARISESILAYGSDITSTKKGIIGYSRFLQMLLTKGNTDRSEIGKITRLEGDKRALVKQYGMDRADSVFSGIQRMKMLRLKPSPDHSMIVPFATPKLPWETTSYTSWDTARAIHNSTSDLDHNVGAGSFEALCPINCEDLDTCGVPIPDISDREINCILKEISRSKEETMKSFAGYHSILAKDWRPDMTSHVVLARLLLLEDIKMHVSGISDLEFQVGIDAGILFFKSLVYLI